jgi:hypothetical protein
MKDSFENIKHEDIGLVENYNTTLPLFAHYVISFLAIIYNSPSVLLQRPRIELTSEIVDQHVATKKESQHDVKMVKGGSPRGMFKQQAAGPAASGTTGKHQTAAPGARGAAGGRKKFSYSSSVPATPGITGSR